MYRNKKECYSLPSFKQESMLSYKTVDRSLAKAEQFLDCIDKIPYFSSFSGIVRFLAGEAILVSAVALLALKVFQSLFVASPDGSFGRTWEVLCEGKPALVYALHGIVNIGRGLIAVIPWVNLIFWITPYWIGRFNYEHEIVEPQIYPLATAWKIH